VVGVSRLRGVAPGALTAGGLGEGGATVAVAGSSAGTLLLLWMLKNRRSVVSLFLLLEVGVLG